LQRKNFDPLETFFDFSNFSGKRKEVLGGNHDDGRTIAVAALLSILFALAAHWQNDNDGGLI
jgi:hypothetical protein